MLRRSLQVVLTILGVVAVSAGGITVLFGADSVVGGGSVSASVDSELRFYATWYVLVGALLLRAVPRVEAEAFTIRAVFVTLFLAGVARVISIIAVGTPHRFLLVLLGLELGLPILLIPWQALVARRRD
ncbi:MAG: DUF4345 domain-containing protein [Actinomycetota bacterium]